MTTELPIAVIALKIKAQKIFLISEETLISLPAFHSFIINY